MEKNEIEKALYKNNPTAKLTMIRKGVAYYSAVINDETEVRFEVPVNDMGDATFFSTMDSKFLRRYIAE